MNEQGMVMRRDAESSGRKARGMRLRSLIRLATPPSPATKLLFVLLVLVVAMWVISYVRELNVIIFGEQSYLLEQRDGAAYFAAEDMILSSDVGGVHVTRMSTIREVFGLEDCGNHSLLGVGYRSDEFGMKILHVHHWLLAALIALPLALLWVRQVIRRREKPTS